MRPRRVQAGVLLVVLGLSAAAIATPAASAAGQEGERLIRFQLKTGDGYSLFVQRRAARRNVSVTVWHNRLRWGTEYVVRSRPTGANRIAARFPGLGRIDVTLRPRGRVRRNPPPGGCGGPGNLIQPAVARGKIRFRGERGYTAVRKTTALAQFVQRPRRRCGGGMFRPSPIVFAAEDVVTSFYADKLRRKGGPENARFVFSVFRLEELRGMFVLRWAWSVGGPQSFVFADRRAMPEHVLVDPPAPFRGEAALERTAESTLRWTGSLGVELLGLGPIRLTGPRFGLRLCIKGRCIRERGEGEDDFDAFFRRREAQRLLRSAVPSPGISTRPGSPGRGNA